MMWSEKYYTGLDDAQHKANNSWFRQMLRFLTDDGILYVPNLDKTFDKQGGEVNE